MASGLVWDEEDLEEKAMIVELTEAIVCPEKETQCFDSIEMCNDTKI